MNKQLIAILGSITSMGLVACEVNGFDMPGETSDFPDGPTESAPEPAGADPSISDTSPLETKYFALFIEDRWNGRCATSSVGAHGADIDAVSLWDPSTNPAEPDLVGYLDVIDADFDPTLCAEYGYTEFAGAKGEPDGTLTENFYALAGGWLIGEFDHQAQLLPGYEVTIHEIDDSYCGNYSCVGSERFDVYLATDLDCPNTGADFRERCMIKLTGSDGAEGTATFKLPDF